MGKIQSIEDIRNKRDEIREKIKLTDFKTLKEQTFGSENEYTYESLIEEVESLLTNISTLAQHKEIFISLTNYQDRRNIFSHLQNILTYINQPRSLYPHVENLKRELRNYNIRYLSENFIEFEKEIDEVRKIKLQLEEVLKETNLLEGEISKKNEKISEANDSAVIQLENINNLFTDIKAELDEIEKKSSSVKTLNSELESIKLTASEKLEEITDFRTESESNKKLIDSFSQKVQERENRLAELEQKTIENTTKLDEYDKERKEILKEANTLIDKSKKALNYTTAEGLSASFNTQYTASNKWWLFIPWLIASSICIIGTLALGYWILNNVTEEWFMILGRILLLPMPIAGAVFCANQYTKQKNIIEDYAYKMTIAKSIVGFSEQLKKNGNGNGNDNSEYINYIQKALEEIHKDPLRTRKEIKKTEIRENQLNEVMSLTEKIVELSKQITKMN